MSEKPESEEFMTSFISSLRNFKSKLWGYYFPVPAEIAEKYIDGQNRRVICNIDGKHSMQCALMPYADGYFLLVNKEVVRRLGISENVEVKLTLEKDNSEHGHEVPETFQMLLDQDEKGRNHFNDLTPGKKRSLIYLVGKVKNIDSQLNKGLAIMDHLKAEDGKLDFKKLYDLIKVYNQRSKLKN